MRIGVDLGGSKIEAIVLGDDGRERIRKRVVAPRGDYAQTLHAIAALVDGVAHEATPASPVGIGIPGAVSPATGLIKNANSTWLIGQPFDRDLARLLDRPVRVANDANCFAISEATDGAGRGAEVVFGVIIGTGVGGGIVVNGAVVNGRNAVAGEWGHMPLPWMTDDEWPGRDCYCGQRGCIETFVSGPALAFDYARSSGENRPPDDIVRRAEHDAAAAAALARYEDRLARGLAAAINVVDPDVIVLGGGMSNVGRLYQNVPGLIGRFAFSDHVSTPVLPPVHGDSSGVRGAAWLWPPDPPSA